RVDRDAAAEHGRHAGHDRVALGTLGIHAEGRRAVLDEGVELDERTLVDELRDALASGLLALGVLLLGSSGLLVDHGGLQPTLEVVDPAGGGGDGFVLCSHVYESTMPRVPARRRVRAYGRRMEFSRASALADIRVLPTAQ